MADWNAIARVHEQRVLARIAERVTDMRDRARGHNEEQWGQRRMATRVLQMLSDMRVEVGGEPLEVDDGESHSDDQIDEGLRA